MIETLFETLLETPSTAMGAAAGFAAVSIVAKATVLLTLALAATRLAHRARASVRHALLASLFGVLLLLPIAVIYAPPIGLATASFGVDADVSHGSPGPVEGAASVEQAEWAAEPLREGRRAPSRVQTAWLVMWAIGTTLFLLPLLTAAIQLRRFRRSGIPWVEGRQMVRRLADEAGIGRHVDVLIHDVMTSPMTYGFARPVVIMPEDAQTWPQHELRHAVVHELEHVRRGDWLVALLARGVCAFYWFHPLVWSALRQLHLEAERACDDAVLAGTERTAYAQQLVALARRMSPRTRQVMGMAYGTDLSARVTSLLDRTRRRGRAGARRVLAIATAAVALMMAIAPLRAIPAVEVQPSPGDIRPAAFDATSVRLYSSSNRGTVVEPHARTSTQSGGFCSPWGRIHLTDTCFTASNITLHELIAFAYGPSGLFGPTGLVPPRPTILGGAAWAGSDRFEVVGRSSGGAEPFGSPRLAMMMRRLLAARFELAIHGESRALPIYELRLSQTAAKSGPRVRRAPVECTARVEALRAAQGGPAPVRTAATAATRAPSLHDGCIGDSGRGYLRGGAIDMRQLALVLSNRLDRVVRDRTGLEGMFEIDLTWAEAQKPLTGASIATALEEQLGLTLTDVSGPVDVLVIDHASRPSAD